MLPFADLEKLAETRLDTAEKLNESIAQSSLSHLLQGNSRFRSTQDLRQMQELQNWPSIQHQRHEMLHQQVGGTAAARWALFRR